MFRYILRFYNTIRYLKFIQFFFQIYYRIDYTKNSSNIIPHKLFNKVVFKYFEYNPKSYFGKNKFSFLNIEHDFKSNIDWNLLQYGKLWNYNLNYLDFLNQKQISFLECNSILNNYILTYNKNKFGKDPYPTSLRIINVIKFVSKNNIYKKNFIDLIYTDTYNLKKKIEYHLLANHILENFIALCFSAIFFNDRKLFNKSKNSLRVQLNEQILNDGCHFELSPMYHSIIINRLLDLLSLMDSTHDLYDVNFYDFVKRKLSKMLGWLITISFNNKSLPLVNDSVENISISLENINRYSNILNISPTIVELRDCGYRMIKKNNFELFVDVGEIGPDYQPGHAHADTFNFILHFNNKPVFVDTSVSTYEIGVLRSYQRSTRAHNTVTLKDLNSSDIWSAFRVGKRAKIISLNEEASSIEASHNGYRSLGAIHNRKWEWCDDFIKIYDTIKCGEYYAKAHFNLAKNINVIKFENHIILNDSFKLTFEGYSKIDIIESYSAESFNSLYKSKQIVVKFKDELISTIFY
tara:strand:- start:4640 stop:6205 length:1566 start_codon:yes stop_codon:yes gene_type:complete